MNKKGFSLIETIVAILIMTGGIIGVYSAIQNVSALAKDSNTRLQASFLALEGAEIVRNIRDNNYKLRDQDVPGFDKWDRYIREGEKETVVYPKIDLSTFDLRMPVGDDNFGANCPSIRDIVLNGDYESKKKCYEDIYNDKFGIFNFLRLDDGKYSYNPSGEETGFKRLVLVSPFEGGAYSNVMPGSEMAMTINSVVIWKYHDSIRWVIVTTNLFDWQDPLEIITTP